MRDWTKQEWRDYITAYTNLEVGDYKEFLVATGIHPSTRARCTRDKERNNVFYVNIAPASRRGSGLIELSQSFIGEYPVMPKGCHCYLENSFLSLLQPTPIECELFKLEFGLEYPLLQYLKVQP